MNVSICIPAYNNLHLFKRCLDSVLEQDYKEYEIIVSDDSDNTQLAEYISSLQLTNLKYVHNVPSLGSPGNWNKSISLAQGKYIKIMHHDDYFTFKNSLFKFVKAMENNPGAHFAFSYAKIHFKKAGVFYINRQTKQQLKRMKEFPEFLFFRNIIGAPSATFFKNQSGFLFNTRYKWLVDVEFYIRYLRKHPGVVHIQEPLVTLVDGEKGQITQSVHSDKKLVITENLALFGEIYSDKLNNKKAWLYFQELFKSFDINNVSQLKEITIINSNLENFIKATFDDMPRNRIWKRILKRFLTSRYNKRFFRIERF